MAFLSYKVCSLFGSRKLVFVFLFSVHGLVFSEELFDFNIPKQVLVKSINQLSNQSETLVLFPYDLVEKKQGNAVIGHFTVSDALTLLLKGTGLVGGLSNKNVLTITEQKKDPGEITLNNKKSVLAGIIAIFAGANVSQSVMAQDESGQSRGQGVLEEVIVTALKRETTLHDTPLAVSVMGGDFLKEAGVNSLSDLQYIAPSVHLNSSPFGVNLNIRGVTTTDNTSKGDQGIAFNVDGITIGRPREMGVALFDVNRIEVLRGPQGTLYGKSTTGGVVNVVTNRPVHELTGKVDVELADYDTKRVTAILNVPVSDNFAARFGMQRNDRDGYLEPTDGSPAFSDQDDFTIRASALWDISDVSTLFVSASKTTVGGIGGGLVPNYYYFDQDEQTTVVGVPEGIRPDIDEDFQNITFEYSTEFAGLDFVYVGGYREYDSNSHTAQSLSPDDGWDWANYIGSGKTKQHELRLSNAEPGDGLSWMLGYNFFREDLSESDHNWTAPTATPTRIASFPGIDPLNTTDHQSQGIFATMDIPVGERLNFTVGARYSKDEVVRRGTFAVGPGQVDVNGNPCVYPNDCIGGPNNGDQSDDKITYRLGFDYAITDAAMVYASIATGYKAGGFNDFSPATGGVGPYDSESLVAYEFGYKGNVSSSLTWNSAFFFYDYDKAQISSLTNVEGNVVLYTRIAPIEIYGWENEIIWQATDADRFNINVSLMDSEYKEFSAGGHEEGAFPPIGAVFEDWAGKSIDKVSDFTASVDYTHDWTFSSGATLTARFATRYNSGYKVSNITYAYQLDQGSFTRSDANLSYISADGKYSIGAFVRNIENDVQLMGGQESSADTSRLDQGVSVTEPRVYGVRFGVEF